MFINLDYNLFRGIMQVVKGAFCSCNAYYPKTVKYEHSRKGEHYVTLYSHARLL